MMKRVFFFLAAIIQVLLMPTAVALCQGTQIRGLQSVMVSTSLAKGEGIINVDIAESQVQTDVELKLRLAGIKVKPDSTAILRVLVFIAQANKAPLGSVRIVLLEPARLVRDPKIMVSAVTWESQDIRLDGGALDTLSQRCRDTARDLTDTFINDYLSVNPK